MSEVTTWRYELPSVDPWSGGWATIVVGSDGFFAAVSDRGNYAYRWAYHGRNDFREFLLDVETHPDSFIAKLSPEGDWPYNPEATLRAVKEYIIELRKEGHWSREQARQEWDLLCEHSDLDSEMTFWDWCRETDMCDVYEFEVRSPNNDIVQFVKTIMPRLAVLLRKDLQAASEGEKDHDESTNIACAADPG